MMHVHNESDLFRYFYSFFSYFSSSEVPLPLHPLLVLVPQEDEWFQWDEAWETTNRHRRGIQNPNRMESMKKGYGAGICLVFDDWAAAWLTNEHKMASIGNAWNRESSSKMRCKYHEDCELGEVGKMGLEGVPRRRCAAAAALVRPRWWASVEYHERTGNIWNVRSIGFC